MDSLYLLQFACLIFMLVNAFIVAVSHLQVRWENKRYECSRWMIVAAMIGLAMQYAVQMVFGFRAMHDNLGAVVNILIYTPCFSLISMGIYNIETTRANLKKMILVCSGIYAAILLVFCVGISLHHSLYIREGLYLMLALFCLSVIYCIFMIIREMIRRKKLLETMVATDMLPYVRYSRTSVIILWLAVLAMPVAIFSTTLLYIVGPVVLFALLFFNLTFIALGNSYTPTEELLDKEEEISASVRTGHLKPSGGQVWTKTKAAGQVQKLCSSCQRSASTLSGSVLTNGVLIWDIRTVLWICWPSPAHWVSPRRNCLYSSTSICSLHSEYGSARSVSMRQRRWCWIILIIAMISFQPSVASLPEPICIGSSRPRRVARLPNGEKNRLPPEL